MAGIGRLADLAIALHLGDPLGPVIERHKLGPGALLPGGRINPGVWAYEGRVQGPPLKFTTPRGSNNHKPVAMLLDMVSRYDPDPARTWLRKWYETMRDVGHDGSEFLSTIYGGVHAIVAMICADLGIPGAAEHLQRQVALCALHLTPLPEDFEFGAPVGPLDRLLVMPGCRCVKPRKGLDVAPEGLEQWARYMLGEDHPERPRAKGGGRVKAGRELTLARRLKARRQTVPWPAGGPQEVLATVRSCVGTLVHRHHERGFVSFFESGPRCYAWPIAAVVCVDGQEPVIVRPPTSAKGKGAGEVCAVTGRSASGDYLLVKAGAWSQTVRLDDLGPLVREVRIGPAQGGA